MAVARTEQFLDDLRAAYSITPSYKPADHHPLLTTPLATKFLEMRVNSVTELIADREHKDATGRAILSEWTSYLAIAKPLDDQGYTVEMAPKALEAGQAGRKGIDLVVSQRAEKATIPLLGINVKLRNLQRDKADETQRFDFKICAPMITLSLGDWSPENRDQQPLDIREWIDSRALPKITTTGKLPHFYQFRQFVFGTVADTLENYLWKTESHMGGFYEIRRVAPDDPCFDAEQFLFPKDPADFATFYEKLTTAHTLFTTLAEKV